MVESIFLKKNESGSIGQIKTPIKKTSTGSAEAEISMSKVWYFCVKNFA